MYILFTGYIGKKKLREESQNLYVCFVSILREPSFILCSEKSIL